MVYIALKYQFDNLNYLSGLWLRSDSYKHAEKLTSNYELSLLFCPINRVYIVRAAPSRSSHMVSKHCNCFRKIKEERESKNRFFVENFQNISDSYVQVASLLLMFFEK